MFAPIPSISNISEKLLFCGAFLLLAFIGYGQDLSIENVTEDEDVGNMVFEVTLDADVTGGTSVSYSLIEDTATEGIDYDNTIGADLIFKGDKDEVQLITVAITDDFIDENDDEDFTVQLGTPTNGVGSRSTSMPSRPHCCAESLACQGLPATSIFHTPGVV